MSSDVDYQKYSVDVEIYEISNDPYKNHIIYTARNIIDAIYSNMHDLYHEKFSVVEEKWRIVQWDGWGKDDNFFKIYKQSSIDQWKDDVLKIKKDIFYLEVSLRYKLSRRMFRIYMIVGLIKAAIPSDADPNPRPARGERSIHIGMPSDFFFKLNQEAFADQIGEICANISATYAVMDYFGNREAPYIQWCPFERFGLHKPSRDVQKKIPSIAWWQYITQPLCEGTGTLEAVFNSFACFKKKLYDNNNASGLSIQLSDKIENMSNEHKLSFRTFFKKSLPVFSLEELAKAYKYDVNSILMEIPLYNDEINKVEMLRQNNGKRQI